MGGPRPPLGGLPDVVDVPGLLRPGAAGLHRQYDMLNRAVYAERGDVAYQLALGMAGILVEEVVLDRYGRPLDPFGREVAPVLGVAVGAALGFTGNETRPQIARVVQERLGSARSQVELAVRRLAKDLSAQGVEGLDAAWDRTTTRLAAVPYHARRLVTDPWQTGKQTRALMIIGRVREAEAIASIHVDGAIDGYGQICLAAGYRNLARWDDARRVTDRILSRYPGDTYALNVGAAALLDRAHHHNDDHAMAETALDEALRSWRVWSNRYTARVIARAAKILDRKDLFPMIAPYLNGPDGGAR